jgi:hypothetical protein
MHAPYEVSSKYDTYTSYKAYKAFFESYWVYKKHLILLLLFFGAGWIKVGTTPIS